VDLHWQCRYRASLIDGTASTAIITGCYPGIPKRAHRMSNHGTSLICSRGRMTIVLESKTAAADVRHKIDSGTKTSLPLSD
jgi:hypothetical protein